MSQGQQKKQSRKAGRNAMRCAAYRNRNQRERNKARKMRRYLRRHPLDLQCQASLDALYKAHPFLKREANKEAAR